METLTQMNRLQQLVIYYKSDLVIGEDDETQIDFETANEIHFDVDNSEILNFIW